ncbi:hypothetical protein NKJ51_23000 [Mesorhizobium sp. M0134]|uniref:hypothetical protein n=1 Tax=Mesorhizobium sp. M0134 TaxID=2956889 RepID=UPI003339FC65
MESPLLPQDECLCILGIATLKHVWDGTVSLWVTITICSFLLFVTALSTLSTRAYDHATKDYQTSRAYDETRRQFEQRCTGLEGKEIFDCLKEQIETAREPSRSEEDVGAQKEMARWALWMLVVSGVVGFATLGITAIGLYYIRDTLAVSRRAMLDTRQLGEAQVQAYLSCTDATFGAEDKVFRCWITIKNNGQSPAFSVLVKAALSVMVPNEGNTSIGLARRVDSSATEGGGMTIPAGGETTIQLLWLHHDMEREAYEKIAKTNTRFNIDCKVRWTNVFHREGHNVFFLNEGKDMRAPVRQAEFDRTGEMTVYNRGS